jgi:hypothetical protein
VIKISRLKSKIRFFCHAGISKNRILLSGKGAMKVYPYKISFTLGYRKSAIFVK